MIPTSALFNRSINRSHTMAVKVSVLDGNGSFLSTIPILDGTVSATLASQVTRSAELVIDRSLSPVDATDLLYPAGNRLYIERGVDYCNGLVEVLPVFHGRIESVIDTSRAPVRLRAVDLAGDIRDANFPVPGNTIVGQPIISEFQRLVTEALPSATFGPSDTFGVPVGAQSWDTDRSQALDDLAKSVGAFWYTLADGRFVIRRVPWTYSRDADATVYDGIDPNTGCQSGNPTPPAGLYVTATEAVRERSRTQVFNIVSVSAERVDGTPPITAVARDSVATSPTWIGGNFGVKTLVVRTDIALSQGQAQTIADTTLSRSKALTDSWGLHTTPDPRVELGDCLLIRCNGVVSTQVVSSLRMPLNAGGKMDISTRALVPTEAAI